MFVFYRDNDPKITFGSYTEQVNTWVNMTMVKQGNTIYMYFNGQLEQTYNETDTTPSAVVGVSLVAPWEGNEAYSDLQFEQLGTSNSENTSFSEPWVPPATNAAAAGIVSVSVAGAAAVITSASDSVLASLYDFFSNLFDKIKQLVPNAAKKWFEDYVESKRKSAIVEKKASPYLLTKEEIVVYAVAVLILTFSFAYVKVINFQQFVDILPLFLATSIIVMLARTYLISLYSRRKGVWTEHKVWPLGVFMYIISTVALRSPFSSPTRTVHHSCNLSERIEGTIAIVGVLITLAFALLFFVLLKSGFALIGGTGLAMCLVSAFFDTFPIKPMNGHTIFKHSKLLWAVIFLASLILYAVWLANML